MTSDKMNSNEMKLLGIAMIAAMLAGGLSGYFAANVGKEASKGGTYTLVAFQTGYVGEGGDIDGMINPVLEVSPGTTMTLTLKAGQPIGHDFAVDELGIKTDLVALDDSNYVSELTITFTVPAGEYTYYCTVAGHRATMNGKIVAGSAQKLEDAKPVDVDWISHDPFDVGTPVGNRTVPKIMNFTMIAKEVVAEIAPGTTFTYWTFNETVPGPLIRAMVGDTINIKFINDVNSSQQHSIDLHAVTGSGGGAKENPTGILKAEPGNSSTFSFVALHEGLFIYHCASPHIPTHISKGMFGSILIEPVGGLPKVDVELFIGQNEVYTKAPAGTPGHQVFDSEAELNEEPTYVSFNGAFGALTGDHAITIDQNSTVRIFFGVGGPNLISSFHMIGEIWDKVWYETEYTQGPNMHSAETVLVAPGSSLMIELTMEKVGSYILVDHAISRAIDKGCLGIINIV